MWDTVFIFGKCSLPPKEAEIIPLACASTHHWCIIFFFFEKYLWQSSSLTKMKTKQKIKLSQSPWCLRNKVQIPWGHIQEPPKFRHNFFTPHFLLLSHRLWFMTSSHKSSLPWYIVLRFSLSCLCPCFSLIAELHHKGAFNVCLVKSYSSFKAFYSCPNQEWLLLSPFKIATALVKYQSCVIYHTALNYVLLWEEASFIMI